MGLGDIALSPAVPPPSVSSEPSEGLTRLELPVIGMHCASCVATIEEAVRGVEGVGNAVVNFATEKLSVDFDPSRTEPSSLAERVRDHRISHDWCCGGTETGARGD